MSKKLLSLLIIACGLSFWACNKNEPEQKDPEPGPGPEEPVHEVPNIALQAINEHGWEAGNQILIHDGTNVEVITLSDINSKSINITTTQVDTAIASDKHLHAAYPAANWNLGEHSLMYYLYFDTSNIPSAVAVDRNGVLNFHRLTSSISFKATGDYDGYILKGAFGETVEYTYYQVKYNYTKNDTYLVRNESGKKTKIEGKLNPDGNRIFFLNGTVFEGGINIFFQKGGKSVALASLFPDNLDDANDIDYGDITDLIAPYEDFSGNKTGNATDLSANEAANCYIVAGPGAYCFKTVKGNGIGGAVSGVTSADLVWETDWEGKNEAERIKNISYTDGYIYFEVADDFEEGNSLIAAKDANGNIVWSWHIWRTKEVFEGNGYDLNSTRLLDRNLGAAGDDEIGLFYQWGRKDPFNIASAYSVSDGGSYDAGIANPTVFYTDWGKDINNPTWLPKKSIYDPCPAGWKIGAASDCRFFTAQNIKFDGDCHFVVGTGSFFMPGYISGKNGKYEENGKGAHYWTRDLSNGSAYMFRADWGIASGENVSLAEGATVRCIIDLKKSSAPIVNGPDMPVMGDYIKYTTKPVPELSGLAMAMDSTYLWTVGDEGWLGKIDFEGNATKVYAKSADMEDVTVDRRNGDLYLALEGSQMIGRIAAPDYNKLEYLFEVEEAVRDGFDNSGLEGCSYYKDDILFVGSQHRAILWKYRMDGTMLSRVSLKEVTSHITEVGGLCYDPVRDLLWIIDSNVPMIFIVETDGMKFLASYSIPFIGNAESLCVDRNHSCVWVGNDDDTSELYKIHFDNL